MRYWLLSCASICIILNIHCGTTTQAPWSTLQYYLGKDSIEVLSVDSLILIPSNTAYLGTEPADTEIFVPPHLEYSVKPVYPPEARERNLEGTVWVKMLITKQGYVKRAVVLKSNTSILNTSALIAAIQWHFSPPKNKYNESVPIAVSVPFKFLLNHSEFNDQIHHPVDNGNGEYRLRR